MAGIAVWLQTAHLLWGKQQKRFPLMTLDWPEEEAKIEGKQRIVLDAVPDPIETAPIAAKITGAKVQDRSPA